MKYIQLKYATKIKELEKQFPKNIFPIPMTKYILQYALPAIKNLHIPRQEKDYNQITMLRKRTNSATGLIILLIPISSHTTS